MKTKKGYAIIDNEIKEVEFFNFKDNDFGIVSNKAYCKLLESEDDVWTTINYNLVSTNCDDLISKQKRELKSSIEYSKEQLDYYTNRLKELQDKFKKL